MKTLTSTGGFVRATVAVAMDGSASYRVERFRSFPMGWKLVCSGERSSEQEALSAARFAINRLAPYKRQLGW